MLVSGENDNEPAEKWEPGPEVTPELFLKWRDARRGESPGEVMTNPVWRWFIDCNIDAFRGNNYFKGPISYGGNPGWCFNRFGRTLTELPDGTRLLIAGEHEDHYDPDFFIYNDVVIAHPDGEIEILGYPEDHFPPTDFHSATLLEGELILIGNLSYSPQRRIGESQVFAYDIATKRFRRIVTSGESPGWISRHEARLDERNGIVVRGGKVDHGPDNGGYLENFDTWRLNPDDWKWQRMTYQAVARWEFVREDGKACRLLPKRMAHMELLVERCGDTPDTPESNGKLLDRLYDPLVPHQAVVDHEWSDRNRFIIDGVPLHFDEETCSVMLTVVGELPEAMMDAYVNEVRDRLALLEGVPYVVMKR